MCYNRGEAERVGEAGRNSASENIMIIALAGLFAAQEEPGKNKKESVE